MDKYQDYVRAVRELGLQPLRIDEFESLTGAMSMSEIINLTAKRSSTGSREELAESLVHATVTASFTIENFGTERLRNLSISEYEERLSQYRSITNTS